MSNVLHFPPPRATFTFTVTHDGESGMWVAVCDDLCVATEAPTYEALVKRVWLIAPEMARENGLNIPEANLRLLFQHESMHQTVALQAVGSGFYPQLRAILLAHGCKFVRQGKGSHEVWHSPIGLRMFPVAVTVASRFMANAVLKQAGIEQRL